MAKLIPLLSHLDAPNGPHRIVIDRFSPLYRGHDTNGIGAVTPVPGYRSLYPRSIDPARATPSRRTRAPTPTGWSAVGS
jgi:hypothetical protein